MRKFPIAGVLLIVLLLGTLVVAGCSGFGATNQGKCSQGDSCRFYTGNRGIITTMYQAPTIFYYRSSDLSSPDGNTAEFNIKLVNDGASDSYGASFISGFSGDMFKVSNIDATNPSGKEINIATKRSSCFFDIMSIGRNLGQLNFLTGCLDSSVNRFGGVTNVNIGQQTLEKIFGGSTWFQKLGLSKLNIKFDDKGTIMDFGVGANVADFSIMGYGRSLMLIVSTLNFESLGGSTINMKGDNADYPGGDVDYKTFKVQMINRWPAGQDYYNLPYQIKSCYSYTTFVSPMICVDPDPFSAEKKVCTSQGYAWGGSQGAPVAVTSVLQTNTGKEVLLDITIKNVGPGTVWDVGYLEACSPYYPGTVKPTMLDTVYIGFAYIGNVPIDCTNFYKVRLDPKTKSAKIVCRYDIRNANDMGTAYATPLKMELWYGYEETISGQVMVRKLD